MDLGLFLQPSSWAAVLTLSLLEIVLGIDNLVFIAILTGRLPKERQKPARQLGLLAALGTRILLLLSLSWIVGLTEPLVPPFHVGSAEIEITGRALILFAGGVFLVWKSVTEIFHKVEMRDEQDQARGRAGASFGAVLINIALMDMIFSLDSVITAVGMVSHIELMVAGVLIAMAVMVAFADPVSNFINANPSLKILALAFLLMIGTLLTAEAELLPIPFEFNKGYVYFAMFFSLAVEFVQMRYESNLRRREGAIAGEGAAGTDRTAAATD
ncbi:MAG: TerC family protein [Actinobacteria bacterium]|nr:MAG: TerC family protein [Actinomycetota bacterium]